MSSLFVILARIRKLASLLLIITSLLLFLWKAEKKSIFLFKRKNMGVHFALDEFIFF